MATVPTPQPSQSTLTDTAPLAKYIDLAKWEHNSDAHYEWQGDISLTELPRVYALRDSNQPDDTPLHIKLAVKKNGAVIMWRLQTDGTLWQTCQRCLEPVAVDLHTDSELALLQDETHIALLAEDTESILLDELTEGDKLYLLSMIEDELLVDLPMAPKHDDCEMAVSQVGELPETVEEKENPFAMLAGLKGQLSS